MLALDVIALMAAGLLVGNELAIAVFVHPVLCRLPDPVHFAIAKALAKVLGQWMPLWYALVTVLTASLAFLEHRNTGSWPRLITFSAWLWVFSIVFTVTSLVPINNRVGSWTQETKPANWKTYRSKWDQLHRLRVLLLTIAFALLVIGLLRP